MLTLTNLKFFEKFALKILPFLLDFSIYQSFVAWVHFSATNLLNIHLGLKRNSLATPFGTREVTIIVAKFVDS